jgi:DNA-binding MarR family transcriptional regulator
LDRSDSIKGDGERAMNALRRLVRALRTSNAAVQRTSGVSGAQLFVLRAIVARPGRSIADLVATTLTNQSTVSEVVARLVERGLVRRRAAPEDRRRAILTPTPAAEQLVRSAPATVQGDLIAALGRLPAGTRHALADGLDQWIAAAGLDDVTPTMFFEPKRKARRARAHR